MCQLSSFPSLLPDFKILTSLTDVNFFVLKRRIHVAMLAAICDTVLRLKDTVAGLKPPRSPLQSCPGSSATTFSPAQHGPLEEQEGPGLGRRDAHIGGTPPNEMVKRRSERRKRSTVQQYSHILFITQD